MGLMERVISSLRLDRRTEQPGTDADTWWFDVVNDGSSETIRV